MSKISLILPSFNVGEYITECVESVQNQTLDDIEILCIDAGSDDGTWEKLSERSKQDKRIKLIRSDKKSYGYQVNLGIKKSTGKYIGIVETDDFVDPHMYEKLYDKAERFGLECIKSDHFIVTGNKTSYNRKRRNAFSEINKHLYNRVLSKYDYEEKFSAYLYTWSGIYLKEFLLKNNIFHNESPGASYQDNGFWFQTMMYADKIMFINEAYYNLRRDNPSSSFFRTDKMHCLKDEYDFIHDRIGDSSFEKPIKQVLYEYCFMYRLNSYFFYSTKIPDEDYPKLYSLIREDTLKAWDNGEICLKGFTRDRVIFLTEVIESETAIRPTDTALMWQRAVRKMQRCRSIYIYGAGKLGIRTLELLKEASFDRKVEGFIVSDEKDAGTDCSGIQVKSLKHVQIDQQDLIVVAVGLNLKNDIIANLIENDINNYIYFRDIWVRE